MAGDLAVDGIFTGVEAGIVMAVFVVVVLVGQGYSLADVLSVFTLYGSPSLTSGLLTHLAVSGVYGIFFGLGIYFLNRHRWLIKTLLAGLLIGLAYGFLLWLAAEFLLFDLTTTLLKEMPPSLMAAAHLVYGLALGLLVQRRQRSIHI